LVGESADHIKSLEEGLSSDVKEFESKVAENTKLIEDYNSLVDTNKELQGSNKSLKIDLKKVNKALSESQAKVADFKDKSHKEKIKELADKSGMSPEDIEGILGESLNESSMAKLLLLLKKSGSNGPKDGLLPHQNIESISVISESKQAGNTKPRHRIGQMISHIKQGKHKS